MAAADSNGVVLEADPVVQRNEFNFYKAMHAAQLRDLRRGLTEAKSGVEAACEGIAEASNARVEYEERLHRQLAELEACISIEATKREEAQRHLARRLGDEQRQREEADALEAGLRAEALERLQHRLAAVEEQAAAYTPAAALEDVAMRLALLEQCVASRSEAQAKEECERDKHAQEDWVDKQALAQVEDELRSLSDIQAAFEHKLREIILLCEKGLEREAQGREELQASVTQLMADDKRWLQACLDREAEAHETARAQLAERAEASLNTCSELADRLEAADRANEKALEQLREDVLKQAQDNEAKHRQEHCDRVDRQFGDIRQQLERASQEEASTREQAHDALLHRLEAAMGESAAVSDADLENAVRQALEDLRPQMEEGLHKALRDSLSAETAATVDSMGRSLADVAASLEESLRTEASAREALKDCFSTEVRQLEGKVDSKLSENEELNSGLVTSLEETREHLRGLKEELEAQLTQSSSALEAKLQKHEEARARCSEPIAELAGRLAQQERSSRDLREHIVRGLESLRDDVYSDQRQLQEALGREGDARRESVLQLECSLHQRNELRLQEETQQTRDVELQQRWESGMAELRTSLELSVSSMREQLKQQDESLDNRMCSWGEWRIQLTHGLEEERRLRAEAISSCEEKLVQQEQLLQRAAQDASEAAEAAEAIRGGLECESKSREELEANVTQWLADDKAWLREALEAETRAHEQARDKLASRLEESLRQDEQARHLQTSNSETAEAAVEVCARLERRLEEETFRLSAAVKAAADGCARVEKHLEEQLANSREALQLEASRRADEGSRLSAAVQEAADSCARLERSLREQLDAASRCSEEVARLGAASQAAVDGCSRLENRLEACFGGGRENEEAAQLSATIVEVAADCSRIEQRMEALLGENREALRGEAERRAEEAAELRRVLEAQLMEESSERASILARLSAGLEEQAQAAKEAREGASRQLEDDQRSWQQALQREQTAREALRAELSELRGWRDEDEQARRQVQEELASCRTEALQLQARAADDDRSALHAEFAELMEEERRSREMELQKEARARSASVATIAAELMELRSFLAALPSQRPISQEPPRSASLPRGGKPGKLDQLQETLQKLMAQESKARTDAAAQVARAAEEAGARASGAWRAELKAQVERVSSSSPARGTHGAGGSQDRPAQRLLRPPPRRSGGVAPPAPPLPGPLVPMLPAPQPTALPHEAELASSPGAAAQAAAS